MIIIITTIIITIKDKYPATKKLSKRHQRNHKRSHPRCYIQKDVLKIFAIFSGKNCSGVSFLIKLQTFKPATLLKRDSNTGAFL